MYFILSYLHGVYGGAPHKDVYEISITCPTQPPLFLLLAMSEYTIN
jgi:hypothetical protein